MARIHLFEIEDQSWFPKFLRNYMTDFLQFLANKTDLYKGVLPLFFEALEKSGEEKIIDLCSGGGGGLLRISEHLHKHNPDIRITLTDYYPNSAAFKEICARYPNFTYSEKPVNALQVPQELKGFRTQFLSFHHFRPDDARQILQNAVDSEQNIAIFESQERSFASILAMLFSPVSVLFVTPFIRPFSIGRIIFTYLIPLVPLCVLWDGIVSSLRTYSATEMQALTDSLNGKEKFTWKIGKVKSGPGKILYLVGTKN
ncbi:MAG: hypothetical protein ACO1O6_01590 [Bacteroidota bacterium]